MKSKHHSAVYHFTLILERNHWDDVKIVKKPKDFKDYVFHLELQFHKTNLIVNSKGNEREWTFVDFLPK